MFHWPATIVRGLDGTHDCTHIAHEIKAAGFHFVGRYYSRSAWKNLTRAEALALSAEGVYIVAIWETDPTHADYFTRDQGSHDALHALTFGNWIGQPTGTPIYYTVDADVSPAVVEDYFRAIAEVHTREHEGYAVGAYAGGAVLEHLLNQKLITYAYLAQSMGWEGSKTFDRWHVKQRDTIVVAGHAFDEDITRGHGGGFLVK